MSSTLQRRQRKYPNNRRQQKRIESNAFAKKQRKFKTNRVCKYISIGYCGKVRDKRTTAASSIMGTGTFSRIHTRKAN